MRRIIQWMFIAGLVLVSCTLASPVHANFFDRVKGIYQAPEHLQDLQNQYNETRDKLESQLKTQQEYLQKQAEQLEASRKQAQELLERQEQIALENETFRQQNESFREHNESLRQQNEALLAENQQLMNRIKHAEDSRQSIVRMVVLIIGSLALLFLLYAVAIRIWRYLVWRKQGKDHREVLLP